MQHLRPALKFHGGRTKPCPEVHGGDVPAAAFKMQSAQSSIVITHRVQEGVSKEEVHSTFQQGRIRTVWSAASISHELKPPVTLSSHELRNTLGITQLQKLQERFHYSPGLPEQSLHLYLQYPTSVPGAGTPQ